MGLLDDAIRQHLDLKRRRGADPTEVERDEREALGPVRRSPKSGPGVDTAPERAPFAYDQDDEGDEAWSEEPFQDAPAPRSRGRRTAEPEPDLDEDALDEPEPEPESAARPSRLSRIFGKPEPEVDSEHDDEAEPEYADEDEPHPAGGHVGDDTVAYDLEEEEHAAPEPPKDDDVLEETPEFLQDTPDHDRLWFEQRPPRDFDLDS
jgi:hypothetical protein